MKLCVIKHPYSTEFAWAPTRYPGPEKLLDAFVHRSLSFSVLVHFKGDIWIIEGQTPGVRHHQPPQSVAQDPTSMQRLYAAQKTVPWSAVTWEDYDIAISLDPIVSDEIIARHPRILFCYHELTHRCTRTVMAARKPWGEYDLYLSHYMRSAKKLRQLPQSVNFPYLVNLAIMREIVKPTNEPAVFLDIHHTAPSEKENEVMIRKFERICGLPVRYARIPGRVTQPISFLTELTAANPLRTREFLELVGSCKYYLTWRPRAIVGQAAIEAAALGLIVVASREGVYHKMLCHPECLIPSGGPPRKGLRLIQRIEKNPSLQKEILEHQDRMLQEKFWNRPLDLLHQALEMKRK